MRKVVRQSVEVLDLEVRPKHLQTLFGGEKNRDTNRHQLRLGHAATHLSATIAIAAAKINGAKVLAVRPLYQCSNLTIDLESDGKAITDFGWTKVPSIGVVKHQPMEFSGLKPQLILDDLPMMVDSHDHQGNFKEVNVAGRTALVEPAWRYFSVSISPSDVKATESGWLVTAAFVAASSNQGSDSSATAAKRDQLRVDTKSFWAPPQCNGDSSLELKLGPFLIGPNNEVVKFFVAIGNFTKEMADRIPREVSTEKLKQWVADPKGS